MTEAPSPEGTRVRVLLQTHATVEVVALLYDVCDASNMISIKAYTVIDRFLYAFGYLRLQRLLETCFWVCYYPGSHEGCWGHDWRLRGYVDIIGGAGGIWYVGEALVALKKTEPEEEAARHCILLP